MKNCRDYLKDLNYFMDNETSAGEIPVEIRRHFEMCSECREYYNTVLLIKKEIKVQSSKISIEDFLDNFWKRCGSGFEIVIDRVFSFAKTAFVIPLAIIIITTILILNSNYNNSLYDSSLTEKPVNDILLENSLDNDNILYYTFNSVY